MNNELKKVNEILRNKIQSILLYIIEKGYDLFSYEKLNMINMIVEYSNKSSFTQIQFIENNLLSILYFDTYFFNLSCQAIQLYFFLPEFLFFFHEHPSSSLNCQSQQLSGYCYLHESLNDQYP